MASFGYVVAAADPPDAAIVSYPDGRYIYTHFSDAVGRGLDARLLRSRVRDCEVTLDALARWNAEDGLFAGRLNTEAAAAMGWSLGGGTAVEWCRVDSRVVAAIALDGAFLDLAPLRASGMSKPVLAMNRPGNTSLDLFGALKGDAIFFEIRNTVHESFSAYYWDLDSNPGDRGREAARTVVDHAVWFLDRSLKEKSDPFPSAADYRLVTNLRRK
ncbi:MAG: hypothetical protein JNL97_05655 [Verrucomicrobiales bacterium]|nr:hypothetical protein [Verrucomicrobiales bacterium]